VAAGDRTDVEVTLPAGFTWATVPSAVYVSLDAGVPAGGEAGSFNLSTDGRTALFTVDPLVATQVYNLIRFSGLNVNVPANFTGNIDATVLVRGETGTGDFVWSQTATVRIATIVTGGTTSTALETLPVLRGVADQAAGNIRIVEVVAGSLSDGSPGPAGTITLTAPSGVTFQSITAGATTTPGSSTATISLADSALAATLDITGIRLNVALTVPDGPINIAISGAGATAASVAIANVGVAGAVVPSAVYAAPLMTINAGRLAEEVASIRLTENMTNAFLGNRMVTFALPSGFTWNSVSNAVYQPQPNAWAIGAPAVSSDGRTLTFWTISDPIGTGAGSNQFDLTGISINTHITAPAGPIVVEVGGNTGATGTVTVATLRRPVTVTVAATPDVRADSRGQALGNLVITEAAAGALMTGNLSITLPAGVTVATPSVAVADVTGTEPTVTVGVPNNVITLTVTAPTTAATNPTTVTVSGIVVDLDRVTAGPITATVAGSAVLEAGTTAGLANVLGTTDVARVNAARGTVVAEVVLGNIIPRTFSRSVFTIGALSFVRDGVTTAIDAAPTVREGRTLLPLRFAALAVGVSEDDIIWDPVRRTVTLFRGDRVVQLRIGDKNMTINGVVVPMDVAASIEGGRTVLPIRFVALALRATVAWDATARTVTVTAQ
jgi:hypothetical protein